MYHDLLFALSGITGDIFKEKYQENSYNIVIVSAGVNFIDAAEESILNLEILPMAGHILYLQRFVDGDDESDKVDYSYYRMVLKNAIEHMIDSYNKSLVELEQLLLKAPQEASLTKVHNILLPWYIPIATLASTIYNFEKRGKFSPKIIDEFNTISASSGNYQTKKWFLFLADKCSSVFVNQTKEVLFHSTLIDPYQDYFIKDLKTFNVNWNNVPETVLSKSAVRNIIFIARTNVVVKVNKDKFIFSSIKNFKSFENMSIKDEIFPSIFSADECDHFVSNWHNLETNLENLKIKANQELIKFIGKDKIANYFNTIKNLFFLADSFTWDQFLENLSNATQATKIFNLVSNDKYEQHDITFVVNKNEKETADETSLDTTFVGDDGQNFQKSTEYVCDIYKMIKSSNSNLEKLNLTINVPYPMNLIFDDWSMERYNYFWRLLLKLNFIEFQFNELLSESSKFKTLDVHTILFVIKNLRGYLYTDVVSSLLTEFYTDKKLFSNDFETVINSHRQFLLRAMQQSFLLSKTLFKLLAQMLQFADNFASAHFKLNLLEQNKSRMDFDDYNSRRTKIASLINENFTEFEKILIVLFNMLKQQNFQNKNRNTEGRFLEMLLQRLDYNLYFSKKLFGKR